jgi:hypothetical protein
MVSPQHHILQGEFACMFVVASLLDEFFGSLSFTVAVLDVRDSFEFDFVLPFANKDCFRFLVDLLYNI